MDIEAMIEMLNYKYNIEWHNLYYSIMNKGYSHEEAICYTYNKFFIENGK